MDDIGLLLQLSGIGMGMTFLAIGALVLGMYAMTRMIKDRPEVPAKVVDVDDDKDLLPAFAPSTTRKAHAAAAAVGVALARNGKQRAAAAAVALALANHAPAAETTASKISGWDTIMRTRQLTQRDRFASRRRMR